MVAVFTMVTAGIQAQHNEFLNLYPDCEDNESSKIYEPKEWPKNLNLPIFPNGGDIEMIRYIHDHVNYPDVVDSTVKSDQPGMPDKVYRAKGVVMVHLTIDRCGKAVNPVVKNSVNEKYDAAAVEVLSNLPIFKPGSINGVRVKVGLLVPVHFVRSHLPRSKDDWGDNSWDDADSGSDSSSGSGGSSGGSDSWGGGGWGSDDW